jgi:hypothetical protein
MSDEIVFHGGKSQHEIAFELLKLLVESGKKDLGEVQTAHAYKKWVLDTYSDCLQVAQGHRHVPKNKRESDTTM